ncbi:hypothetical protein [Salmonella phage SSBI34]|nr:hypothetical protein [Salmonella phage SSBI34]
MITLNRDVNEQVKNFIRRPQESGYPLILVMKDGGVLCHECAKKEFKMIIADTREGWNTEWTALGTELFLEGPVIECAHCYKDIESAYGDPNSEE